VPARLFVELDPEAPDRARLDGAAARHLRALRLGVGGEFRAIVGPGRERAATLEAIGAGGATCRLGAPIAGAGAADPVAPLVLAVAIADLARLDLVVEKATELGASAILPFRAARSQRAALPASRLARWERIARTACEQCGRTVVPAIAAPVELDELVRRLCDATDLAHALVLSPRAEGELLATLRERAIARASGRGDAEAAAGVALVIGPEGGLVAAEEDALVARGAMRVGLGPRTLRVETAAIAALALASSWLADASPPGVSRARL